jgi:hypothetical protein
MPEHKATGPGAGGASSHGLPLHNLVSVGLPTKMSKKRPSVLSNRRDRAVER